MVAIEPPILGFTTRGEYRYNGLNWRVGKLADTDNDGALDEQRLIYYTANWQIAEERVTDRSTWSWDPSTGIDRFVQYIWGPRYIDDLIARRVKDENDGDTGVYDEILYHLTDAMFSTRVVADNAMNIKERISYDAYGEARHSWQGDVDGDGDVDPVDANRIAQLLGKPTTPVEIHDAAYEVQADLNADGVIDSDDEDLTDTIRAALGNGELSSTGNVIGWDGYVFNPELQHSIVRHRHYSPEWGRWLERDPLRFIDGTNWLQYARSDPVSQADAMGLFVGSGTGKYILCYRFGFLFTLRHCEVSDTNCSDPKWSTAVGCTTYPIFFDNRDNGRTLPNGTACSEATLEEIRDCIQNRHGWDAPGGYNIGNNCQTWSGDTVKDCCGMTRWSPSWYVAYPYWKRQCLKWSEPRSSSNPYDPAGCEVVERDCLQWAPTPWYISEPPPPPKGKPSSPTMPATRPCHP